MCIEITQVKVLPVNNAGRLRAVCEIVINEMFVIKEVKIVETRRGTIVRLPEKEAVSKCHACGRINSLRAKYCNFCGAKLTSEPIDNFAPVRNFQSLFYSVVVPLTFECREHISEKVLKAYSQKMEGESVSVKPEQERELSAARLP